MDTGFTRGKSRLGKRAEFKTVDSPTRVYQPAHGSPIMGSSSGRHHLRTSPPERLDSLREKPS